MSLEMSNIYPTAKIYFIDEDGDKELLAEHRSFETEDAFNDWIDEVKEKHLGLSANETFTLTL